jgi:hypothetical protein
MLDKYGIQPQPVLSRYDLPERKHGLIHGPSTHYAQPIDYSVNVCIYRNRGYTVRKHENRVSCLLSNKREGDELTLDIGDFPAILVSKDLGQFVEP